MTPRRRTPPPSGGDGGNEPPGKGEGILRRAGRTLGEGIEKAGDVVEELTDRIGEALGADPDDGDDRVRRPPRPPAAAKPPAAPPPPAEGKPPIEAAPPAAERPPEGAGPPAAGGGGGPGSGGPGAQAPPGGGDEGEGDEAGPEGPQAAIGSEEPTPEGDTAMAEETTPVAEGTAVGEKQVRVGHLGLNFPLQFIDLRERDEQERRRLKNQLALLEMRLKEDGNLPELLEQVEAIKALLQQEVADPFFRAVRASLVSTGMEEAPFHRSGFFPTQREYDYGNPLTRDERTLASVCGLLAADNVTRPEVGSRFVSAVSQALGEYAAHRDLFDAVLRVVGAEGVQEVPAYDGDYEPRNVGMVRTPQWVTVVRQLRGEGIRADDDQLVPRARSRFQQLVGSSDSAAPSAIDIDLPDLEAQADLEIVGDNVRATQALHFAGMLEEMRLFQVVDKLVEQFQNGMLPLGRGRAGDLLFSYWKKGVERLSEGERRNIYARTFGMPGGDPSVPNPNREFSELFLRFVSAVSEYVRQFQVDDLLRSTTPFRVSEEHVRKAGRDLAANLSLHGYGIAHFAATELQGQLNEIIAILSDPEIKNAYGARDMWQVVDQVATLELGGARNGIRYRTMATSGAIIIRWLAERAGVLSAGYGTPLLDMSQLRRPVPRTPGTKPTTHPTDRDLVDAVEQWLAVTGTPDTRVEEYSQPVESPNQTSRPIQIPQVARDLLESVGVSAGYGGGGAGNGSRFQFR